MSDEWYWDLNKHVAVPAAERGPGDHTLGPYPSKAEAENWKATSEARNQAWEDAWDEPEEEAEEEAGEETDDESALVDSKDD